MPFTDLVVNLGWLYIILVFIMFTGSSNAVNITDGMDGLAAGTCFFALIPFILFAWQNELPYIALFILGVLGSLLGYLKYNLHPARIFMGDTGSLALGGLLAALAFVLKQEIALIFIGGVFVYETLCVILQIGSVKIRKKKIFKYTPIHYSFVINGMNEVNVVKMFWMMGFCCMVIGLMIGVLG
ncbi:Phospho-N-acetylmuramoyl-pentapeptide-transferase [bioreactor metagenome]|uniref:Phospho-N-acetylmuramoyl-pentapeptide-transferase n=1 Tax=bioreactor metagenome TaxID=1076179 RepID=A0A645EZW1_9ZZZZ